MNFTRLAALGLLALVINSTLPSTAESGSLWGKVSDEEWKQGPPALYPDANAAVLFDVCTLTVRNDDITEQRHVRMKLFNKKGADEIGKVTIDYYKNDVLHQVKAQTISLDGKITKVDGKEIHGTEIGDWRSKVFTFPAMDSGCIVEYTYSNVNTRWHYIDPWDFQCSVFTFKSSYVLVLAPGYTYFTVASNVPTGDRASVEGKILEPAREIIQMKTFAWTRVNLPPLREEPFMGARSDFQSSIYQQLVSYEHLGNRYTYISNWKGLGEEFKRRVDQYCVGGDIGALADEFTQGVTSDVEKAKRLYEYVARTIQYKPDPSGYRFTNDNLGKLRKSGSGTGQEKNLFLCELLKKAGIKAWPVLVSTRDHGNFNPEVFDLQQFNYLITFAQFDSGLVFMDAVSRYCPFGLLPPNKLVDGGFLVDGGESQLVKVLRNEPKSYRLDVTDVTIDSTGLARCSTSCSMSGYFAPTYGELHEAATPEKFVRENFLDGLDANATIDTNKFELDSMGRCNVEAVYTMNNFVRSLDNNLVLQPVSYRFRKNPFTDEKRSYPIDFKFAQTYHNIVIITSARPITAATLPPDLDLSIDGATYRRVSQFQDGVVHIDAKLTLTKHVFPPGRYPEIKKLFEEIAKAQQDDFVLTTEL